MKQLKKLLNNKHKNPLIQFIKYFFAGGVAALIDISSFSLFVYILKIYYPIAIFLSFTLGTFTNFAVCNLFIFDRGIFSIPKAMFRHYISSLGGLVTNEVVVILIVELIGYSNLFVSKIIATAAAFIVNFLLIKFFAFNNRI